jgi:hypothetical protein
MDSAQGIIYGNDKQIKKLTTMMVFKPRSKANDTETRDDKSDDNGFIEYKIATITSVEDVVIEFINEMTY